MSGRFSPCFLGALAPLLFFPVLANAADAPQADAPQADAPSCEASAVPFLLRRLAVWQQRLDLQDWTISVTQTHPADLKKDTLGNIHWDADKKTAAIRVLDAADYSRTCADALADMEFTIVHELIHLELSSLPRSDASRRAEEHAVNHIADALLQLDRGK